MVVTPGELLVTGPGVLERRDNGRLTLVRRTLEIRNSRFLETTFGYFGVLFEVSVCLFGVVAVLIICRIVDIFVIVDVNVVIGNVDFVVIDVCIGGNILDNVCHSLIILRIVF